jgi:hypothetical protein
VFGRLSSFSVGTLGSGSVVVEYYDTKDFLFAEKGINIYTTLINNSQKELIIRYDAEQVTRIEFLKNIPNFFKLPISKGASIHNYYDQISEAIYKVFPAGLSVNVEEYLRASVVVVSIHKKRESYRVVNNVGLKMILNFEQCDYYNTTTRSKFSQPVLDVFGETEKNEDFELFLKHVVRDHPQLLKLPDNELEMVRSNT